MKFAYADPPYLGCGKLYRKHHADALDCDSPAWHQALINRLQSEFPDGWALSMSSPSLRVLLPMLPVSARIGAWVKPFAVFKPGVNPSYSWEPFAWVGGRKRTRQQPTVRDFISANITMLRGLPGAKPEAFCRHIFEVLGAEPQDEMVDLFPGTNAFSDAWLRFTKERAA